MTIDIIKETLVKMNETPKIIVDGIYLRPTIEEDKKVKK